MLRSSATPFWATDGGNLLSHFRKVFVRPKNPNNPWKNEGFYPPTENGAPQQAPKNGRQVVAFQL